MKMMSIKLDDAFYIQAKEYAEHHNSSLAGMSRYMLEEAFFDRLNFEVDHLAMIDRMLAEPERYQLSPKEIVYWQNKRRSVQVSIEKFADFRADLAAKIQKQVDEVANA